MKQSKTSPAEGLPCRITAATEADVPIVLGLVKRLAEYEHLSQLVSATEADFRDALFGAHPSVEAVLAFVGDEPVGFALFFASFSTFLGRAGLYLEDVFVEPDHRGKGVGKALLKHLAVIARERNYGRMEWAVLDWNQPAIGFYKRLGAQMMDEWTICRLTGPSLETLAEK